MPRSNGCDRGGRTAELAGAVAVVAAAYAANAFFNHTGWGLRVKSVGAAYVFAFFLPFGVIVPAAYIGWIVRTRGAAARWLGVRIGWRDGAAMAASIVIGGLLAVGALASAPGAAGGVPNLHRLFALLLVASTAEVLLFLGALGNATQLAMPASRGWRSGLVTLVVSSLAFGFFHFTYPAPWNTVDRALALTLVWVPVASLFLISRSLIGAIVLNNLLAVIGFVRNRIELPGTTAVGWREAALAGAVFVMVFTLTTRAGLRRVSLILAASVVLGGTPLVAEAQPAAKLYRVGVLDVVSEAANAANLGAFRQGLRELGYVEGQNLVIDYRSADGRPERFVDLAKELVRLEVDVIVTRGASAALGARHVTGTIPIVVASSGDPVFAGLAASLTRPGGNVTGLHTMVPSDIGGQRLRLLKELMPSLSRVGVFLDAGDVYARLMMRDVEKVAPTLGIRLHSVETRRPEDFERAFEAALLDRVDALIVLEGVLTAADLPRIVGFATMSRLPALYGAREFVDAGGLIAYGVDLRDLFRRSATYVHKIFKGANPAGMPMEPPAKFEIVINVKTARTLGPTIPQPLLRRADQIVE